MNAKHPHFILFLSLAVFASPLNVFASPASDLLDALRAPKTQAGQRAATSAPAVSTKAWQDQIAQLTKILAELIAKRAAQITAAASPPQSTPPTARTARTLARGMRGDDVRDLQLFLIARNLLASDAATGFFGALTEAAVKKWQSQKGIVSSGTPATTGYGAVGRRTRESMTGATDAGNVSANSTPTPRTPPVEHLSPTASCGWYGTLVPDGSSVTAYQTASVAFGSQCVSERRVCSGGSLSGSYSYAACAVGQAASACTWNNASVADNASVTAYQTSSVPFGTQCVFEQRRCTNGAFSGTYQFASCAPEAPAACAFNGQTVAHGASVTAYQASTVPYGQPCASQTRTCSNGTLGGTYTSGICTPGAPASCTWNGQSKIDGQSVTAYQSSSVPYGSQCVTEQRTCTNGTLSGTYQYATCSVAAATCTPEASQTQTLSCPAGQTGSITQTRTSSCPGPTWGAWTTTSNTCTTPPPPPPPPIVSRANQKTAISGNNIYSPDVITQGGLRYVYFGGWMDAGQTHDNIYRAQCGNLGDGCTGIQAVIDSNALGFEHVNDPSIVTMPGGYYIMYTTTVGAGLNAFVLANNKISYSTSFTNDGVNWSTPAMTISDAWLPSATLGPSGEVEVYANSTTNGLVMRYRMGTSGTVPQTPQQVTFSNGQNYLNVDVEYRPSIGMYQMLGERQGSTAIDYFTSTDGINFTLGAADVATAQSAGVSYIRTPAQDSASASWMYYAGTNNPNATDNRIFFQTWQLQ